MNKRNLVEMIRKIVKEESTDIRKVDKSNLASTASNFLNALSKKGFTGKYNPDEARGVVELNGIEIHFTTGGERIYFEISKFSIESPDANSVIGKLSDIFKVAESGLLLKPKRSKKKSAVKEYYDEKMMQEMTGGVIAGGVAFEGKKVDRMVSHIKKSEIKAGKSADKAEDIAWATVNKRGYLDNKNKKKGK